MLAGISIYLKMLRLSPVSPTLVQIMLYDWLYTGVDGIVRVVVHRGAARVLVRWDKQRLKLVHAAGGLGDQ